MISPLRQTISPNNPPNDAVRLYGSYGYNEKYPPTGAKKPYVARITGRDPRMTFAREFLARDSMVDTPGLYEIRCVDKKGRPDDSFFVILPLGEQVTKHEVNEAEAMKIAKALEDGITIDEVVDRDADGALLRSDEDETLVVRSAAKAKKAVAAATVAAAVDAMMAALAGLDEHGKKAAIKEVRKRLDSPPAGTAVPLPSASEAAIIPSDPVPATQ